MLLNKYKKYTVFMLFLHKFEDCMWNYCNIKVYLTLYARVSDRVIDAEAVQFIACE